VSLCSAVKEANPNGADQCTLSPSIMQCFHSHEEEVSYYLNRLYSSFINLYGIISKKAYLTAKVKLKQSYYTPRRCLGGEEI
jgi:hypothetical protein